MTNREWVILNPKELGNEILKFCIASQPTTRWTKFIELWEEYMDSEHKEELKPCPFCGATDCVGVFREDEITEELKEVSKAPWGWAVCCDAQHGGCGATGGYKPNKERAIAAWNGRA